jgi:transcriptional/translational regulatory protein YebC/TACO1
MFDRKGQISVDAARYDEGAVMEAALEAGAEDMEADGESYTVTTDATDFHTVQDGLRTAGIEWQDAELAMVPKTTIRVEGKDAERLVKLLDALEDSDDVQKVYANADIDEDALIGAA